MSVADSVIAPASRFTVGLTGAQSLVPGLP
jgi:hypothetical protein